MPIVDLQRSIAEAGRIRIGQKAERGNPTKLDTFRLTSADRLRIEQAAAIYGGKVEPWQAPAGPQFEVITTVTTLDVIVPPSALSFSQYYELWSAGGCQRRCDGVTESIGDRSCVCDPANRECDIHSRLSVLLRDLPGLGVWRIDTQGYYAAVELAGAVQIIELAAGRGALLPARLRLEQRSVKRPGANGRPVTLRFAVPVLDVEISPAELLANGAAEPLALTSSEPRGITPVPAELAGPPPTIAEQSEPPPPRPARRNAAPELPASGRQRAGGPLPAAVAQAPARPDPALLSADGDPSRMGDPVDQAPDRLPDFVAARPRPAPAAPAEPARDPQYWPSRVHAAAGERGIDHDGVRLIAAAVVSVPTEAVAEWSSSTLTEEQWGRVDAMLRQLPKPLDQDAASKWLWAIGRAKGAIATTDVAAEWGRLDMLAGIVYRIPAGAVTPAQWVALGIRIAAGEYEPAAEAVPA